MHELEYEHYPIKGYIHFDYPIHISKVESYVQNRKAIAEHSFYPLIAYDQKQEKFTINPEEYTYGRPFQKKKRSIKYAGHLDGYIYKYYANELNKAYARWAHIHNIDECSVAYRNNKKGKSNIDFAAEVIQFLHKTKEAFVLVGDFKSYFDSLNHRLLKERMCKVLSCERLDDDWYNVFKSVTKYGYIKKSKVEEFFGSEKEIRQKNQKRFVSKAKSVSDFRKTYKINSNKTDRGVPQGVAISAVLSNVYAIEFDAEINRLVNESGGIFRRYSDDFIIVIPKITKGKEYTAAQFQTLIDLVHEHAEKNGLEMAEQKTHIYERKNDKIYEIFEKDTCNETHIDYLGFYYDGINVSIRQRSIERFYSQMKRFIRKMEYKRRKNNRKKDHSQMKKIPHRDLLYSLYTDRGFKKEGGSKGTNFIEYVKRAQSKFDEISPETNNKMMDQIKNRKKKVEKLLGARIYVRRTNG